ncbi:ABC transporter permease family protein [Micromonospora zhanjiangensis]
MSGAVRRIRAFAGQFALLGLLALVAALLLSAAPRLAFGSADRGLRGQIAAQPPAVRDLSYEETPTQVPGFPWVVRPQHLDGLLDAMPSAVRDVIGDGWYAAQTGTGRATGAGRPANPPLDLVLRASTETREAVTMVDGRWPSDQGAPDGSIEVAVAADVATSAGVRTGMLMNVKPNGSSLPSRRVTIVGTFRAVDPGNGVWDSLPSVLRITPGSPQSESSVATAVALTNQAGLDSLAEAHWPVSFSWRYRIAADRLTADNATPVLDALRQVQQQAHREVQFNQGLATPLAVFLDRYHAALTVLSVVSTGVLATLGGLVILAAGLAVRRRAAEFALIRARGGAVVDVGWRALLESLLVIPPAAAVGWLAGLTVPGRGADTGWLVVAAALLITLALPVTAVVVRSSVAARADLTGRFRSARRLTVEVALLAVAVLGTVLLRRRGLPPGGGIDPLLAAVPVLLAAGAAILVLRGYPLPLRLAGRLAGRSRGVVGFLGLARAGRSAVTGPLIVVVMAVATAGFCAVVASGVTDSRDRAADLAVPADLLLIGDHFAADTADELAGQPGVRAVAPLLAVPATELVRSSTEMRNTMSTYLLLVDAPALTRVAELSGTRIDLPDPLRTATPGVDPVPALVSPAVAADLAGGGVVTAQGGRYAFRTDRVVSSFPTVPAGTDRFVVLPWQALRAAPATPLTPTGFLLSASGADPVALRETGERGQTRWFTEGLVTALPTTRPPVLTSRATAHADLDSGGANGVLLFGIVLGVAGGAVLGLLAIAFAVLAGAQTRGRVLSRLRTMGLSRPQWRGLLLVELAPLIGVAMLTGAVTGVLSPLLLTPVLGLDTFTAGVPVLVRFDVTVFGGALALGAVALAVAIAVEAIVNRRLRLGEVLRLGEEI